MREDIHATGGRANGLYHVVCRTCASNPDDSYAAAHETLTADRVFATLVYGEHDRRGHDVVSLDVS